MKKRFEIYLDEDAFSLLERLKADTGYKKPGLAIIAAVNSYFRQQREIKRLLDENIKLKDVISRFKAESKNK